jgi:hypothetical protein
MKTYITTAHEEQESSKSRTFGVLLNTDENHKRVDSLIYIYRETRKMYIFFQTIMDMNEFLLYGDGKMQRAYLSEEDFDTYWDAPSINGKFTEQLTWSSAKTT